MRQVHRQYQRMMTLERKQDTRRKIQLGGLIKKAGLEHENTAVLYGLLLEAADKLMTADAKRYREHWRIIGDVALTSEQSLSLQEGQLPGDEWF